MSDSVRVRKLTHKHGKAMAAPGETFIAYLHESGYWSSSSLKFAVATSKAKAIGLLIVNHGITNVGTICDDDEQEAKDADAKKLDDERKAKMRSCSHDFINGTCGLCGSKDTKPVVYPGPEANVLSGAVEVSKVLPL